MADSYDVIIFGSGFGGSLMSMVAHRLGLRTLMLERGVHPRFAIGESTSPLTNLIMEELAESYDLPFLLPFCTFGAWQEAHPDIGCGLKRGFTYYQQWAGEDFRKCADRSSQLMVAASPRDAIADTHWLRSDFDAYLVNQAVEMGIAYRDQCDVVSINRREDHIWEILGSSSEGPFRADAKLLIDATGPRGIMHRMLDIPEAEMPDFPNTQALFSHFTGVKRCDTLETFAIPGSKQCAPPYPADDAALHHCFHGGWTWVLRFGNGVTSAGISVTDELATELGLPGDLDAAWQRYLSMFPSIREHLGDAVLTRPLIYAPRLSYRTSRAAGDGWAMLPSAAAFIDPLFSTGIPLNLLGIERLGVLLSANWDSPDLNRALNDYGSLTLAEVDSTAEFIGASLRALSVFRVFAAFSQFYFAAASYSEMARRFGKRHLVTRFLAADRCDFRTGLTDCIAAMQDVLADPHESKIAAFENRVSRGIECLNIAGLADPSKRNWYGVDLQDVIDNAHKLEMTPQEVREVLAKADWV